MNIVWTPNKELVFKSEYNTLSQLTTEKNENSGYIWQTLAWFISNSSWALNHGMEHIASTTVYPKIARIAE